MSEIAFAFVLLAGAALFIKSYTALTAIEPGFIADNVLAMSDELPESYRDSPRESYAFFAELEERLGSLSGVEAVGTASQMPFMGGTSWPPTSVETSDGIIDDSIHGVTVTPEYFATMKIPLLAGRPLAQTDRFGTPHVAVVSETMVRHYWPEDNPIGRRVRINVGDDPEWITVVGVVDDVKYGLDRNPYPQIYRPFAQDSEWFQNIVVKSEMKLEALTPVVRELLRSMDPDVPIIQKTKPSHSINARSGPLREGSSHCIRENLTDPFGACRPIETNACLRHLDSGLPMNLGGAGTRTCRQNHLWQKLWW